MKARRRDGLIQRGALGGIKRLREVLLLFASLSVVGCQEREVLLNISQGDSLEALVALNRAGISAYRSQSGRSGSERFSIVVSSSDYNTAAEVLHEFGLPRPETESIEKLTEQKGFVPNPQEIARVRLDRALAAEVERMLQGFPGVVDARVTVRSGGTGDGKSEPSASVVLRYIPTAGKTPFSVDDAKQLVASSVQGLKTESVLITTSRVVLPGGTPSLGVAEGSEGAVVALTKLSPFNFQIPENEKQEAQRQLAVVFGILGLGLGLIFGVIGYVIKPRRPAQKSRPSQNQGERFFIEAESTEGSRSLPVTSGRK